MKSLSIVAVIVSLLFFSCGSSSGSTNRVYQDPHSKMHQEMHNQLYEEEILKVLDGKWLIKQVYAMALDSIKFEGKQPEMIFDVAKEKVAGNDGCNSFQGKVEINRERMTFGPMATTLMACPDMEFSNKIMESFAEKELNYTFNNDLILYQGDQQVLLLKRPE